MMCRRGSPWALDVRAGIEARFVALQEAEENLHVYVTGITDKLEEDGHSRKERRICRRSTAALTVPSVYTCYQRG